MTTLVVAAHPDDEVLGCGGTIARLAAEGEDVHIAILGEGITSRYDKPSDADPNELQQLHDAARDVAALLGAKDVHLFGLPDNRFDTVPMLEIVKHVEGLVDRLRPDTIYCQHGGDLNVDHQAVFRATLTATRPMAGEPVLAVYAFPVASSSEWSFQQFAPAFHADTFVDVSTTLALKVEALSRYEGEVRRFPHPRSPEALEATARSWGSVVGLEAAEPFHTVRVVR